MISHEVKSDVGLFFGKVTRSILIKQGSLKRIPIVPREPR